MKKSVIVLVLVILLSIPVSAFAKTYVDEAGGFSIEIPENTGTYYYTPTDTNMTGTLLESAQSGSELTKLLIGSYNEDNVLGYSLKLEITPVDAAQPDPLVFELEQRKQAQAQEYTFSEIADAEIANQPAKVLEGPSTKDPGYSVKIIALESNGNVIVQTVIYKNDDVAYLQQAEAVLATMTLGDVPTPTPEQSAQATQTEQIKEPASAPASQQPVPTSQPIDPDTLQPAPEPQESVTPQTAPYMGLSVTTLVIILAGIIVLIIVVVILIVRSKKKVKAGKQSNRNEDSRLERNRNPKKKAKAGQKKGTRFK